MSEWLDVCRAAAAAAREAVVGLSPDARSERLSRGQGGDMTMALDKAAEDAILRELERSGRALTAISEEAGVVELNGGGPPYAVVDPVDGSLNAKRGLPFYAVSIAIATGMTMDDVDFGYVLDLGCADEWRAQRGGGAWLGDERLGPLSDGALEIVGVETARPELVARIGGLRSDRVRALGSVALSMCLVAAGRLDGMVSLRAIRSVDAAASQLIVREAGAGCSFPDVHGPVGLGLDMRSRVAAARGPGALARLLEVGADPPGEA